MTYQADLPTQFVVLRRKKNHLIPELMVKTSSMTHMYMIVEIITLSLLKGLLTGSMLGR